MTRWLSWFMRIFTRPAGEPAPEAPDAPPPIGHNRPPKPKAEIVNRETEGAFFYLKDVLDKLDQCHSLVRRLRKADRDAYEYHRRVGAKVVPDSIGVHSRRLNESFLRSRPGNGMMLLFCRDGDDRFPTLLYFKKLKRPHYVQAAGGDIYQCLDLFFVKGNAYGVHFHIAVDSDGRGTVLRERGAIHQRLPRGGTLVRVDWDWPEALKFWFANKPDANDCKAIEEYAWERFCIVANLNSLPANDELLVRCKKGGITSSMNVCTKRTPYFFQDRETTVASDGRRKRIFHIVREHERRLANGETVTVKGHYRGERKFDWNGYHVVIALPKTQNMERMPLAGEIFEEDAPLSKEHMTAADVGNAISEVLDTGEWRERA